MHDTRLVRYTPMRLPYLWKEEQAGSRCGGEAVERSIIPAAPASSAGTEGGFRRKKYVQLLTEGALRRRLHMDRLERVGLDAAPRRGVGIAKSHGESVVKRKALANATNMDITHAEGSADADSEETRGLETGGADTPKRVRMERKAALSENLSIPNMMQAGSSRKAVESVQQLRRTGSQSLRRKRGQFDLYAQGMPSEFSLLPKTGHGRN